jgi:hypothetical protein
MDFGQSVLIVTGLAVLAGWAIGHWVKHHYQPE